MSSYSHRYFHDAPILLEPVVRKVPARLILFSHKTFSSCTCNLYPEPRVAPRPPSPRVRRIIPRAAGARALSQKAARAEVRVQRAIKSRLGIGRAGSPNKKITRRGQSSRRKGLRSLNRGLLVGGGNDGRIKFLLSRYARFNGPMRRRRKSGNELLFFHARRCTVRGGARGRWFHFPDRDLREVRDRRVCLGRRSGAVVILRVGTS